MTNLQPLNSEIQKDDSTGVLRTNQIENDVISPGEQSTEGQSVSSSIVPEILNFERDGSCTDVVQPDDGSISTPTTTAELDTLQKDDSTGVLRTNQIENDVISPGGHTDTDYAGEQSTEGQSVSSSIVPEILNFERDGSCTDVVQPDDGSISTPTTTAELDTLQDPPDSSVVPESVWRYCIEDGQEMYVNLATDQTWIPARDENGKSYYYEVNSRQSVWELEGCDMVSIHHNSSTTYMKDAILVEQPLLSQALIRDNVVGKANFDSSSSFDSDDNDDLLHKDVHLPAPDKFTISRNSPDAQTTLVADKGSKKPFRKSLFLSNTSQPKSLSRPLSLIDFQDRSHNSTGVHMSSDHISGPSENKLTHFERRCMVEHTFLIQNDVKQIEKWHSALLLLSGQYLLIYKNAKSASPKPKNPFGKPMVHVNIRSLEITDADSNVTIKKSVLKVLYHVNGKLFVHLIALPENVYNAWKAAFCFARNLVDNAELSTRLPTCFTKPCKTNKFDSSLLNKLLEFFRNRPSAAGLFSRGILKNELVFGSTIEQICEYEKSQVPNFVVWCIRAIEAQGLNHPGIYRISSNAAQIQKLRFAVNQNQYMLNSDRWTREILTGALKLFFRELKEPLITFSVYHQAIDLIMQKNIDVDVQIARIRDLLRTLPEVHSKTATILFHHLHRVMRLSDSNLMDSCNLAIVFGPTLMWPKEQLYATAFIGIQVPVVRFILDHVAALFGAVCPPPVVT